MTFLARKLVPQGHPSHLLGTNLGRTARNRLCQQRILATVGEFGEPAENGRDAQTESGRHVGHRLAFTYRIDRLLAHDLKRVMTQFAPV